MGMNLTSDRKLDRGWEQGYSAGMRLIPSLLTVVQPDGAKESTKTNTFAEHLPSFAPVDLQGRHY